MELTSNVQRLAFKVFICITACSVFLCFSLFSYGLLYYLYIPAIAHVKPVYLLYDTMCLKIHLCKNPYANISLTENSDYELLTRGQVYAIELVLNMPESERNLNQGMFMVRMDILSQHGEVLQSSKRPAILRYRSPLFKIIYTIFFIPALLLGTMEEQQSLTIPLFEKFVEYNPTYYVYIELEARNAEVYSSALKIHAQFTGLRYMMYYWPVLSLVVGVGSNFLLVTTIALFFWIRQELNSSQNNSLSELSDPIDRDTIEEIRRAVQERQLESQSCRSVENPVQATVLPEVETLSSHGDKGLTSSSLDSPPTSAGIRRRTTIDEIIE